MKKYVKLVVGLILVFTVIKPILNISADDLKFDLPEEPRAEASELMESLDKKEKQDILRIYRGKLAENVENEVLSYWGCESEAEVAVEEENRSDFGNIKSIMVKIQGRDVNPDVDEVKRVLNREFEVDTHNITVKIL